MQQAWFPKVSQDFLAQYQASYGTMREPIQAPDGTQYSWNDEKKNYFDEKENELPKDGFDHEGVKYTYDIENLRWLADGKPLGTGKIRRVKLTVFFLFLFSKMLN